VILIEHGCVITVDRERRVLTDGSILVDGRDIVQVGPARDVRPPRPPDRVIDARRAVVLPGFVDTHVHLSEHVNRGLLLDDIPVDRYLPDWLIPLYAVIAPEEERYSALLACLEMTRTGTTTFCEAGTLFDVGAVADAVERSGCARSSAAGPGTSWAVPGASGRRRRARSGPTRRCWPRCTAGQARASGPGRSSSASAPARTP
jgi:cytosine/adenosine deaminase-related metal-dependent hydrolase